MNILRQLNMRRLSVYGPRCWREGFCVRHTIIIACFVLIVISVARLQRHDPQWRVTLIVYHAKRMHNTVSRHLLVSALHLLVSSVGTAASRLNHRSLHRDRGSVVAQIVVVAHRVVRAGIVILAAQECALVPTARRVVAALASLHHGIFGNLREEHLLRLAHCRRHSQFLALPRTIDGLATALKHLSLRLWWTLPERVLALGRPVGKIQSIAVIIDRLTRVRLAIRHQDATRGIPDDRADDFYVLTLWVDAVAVEVY